MAGDSLVREVRVSPPLEGIYEGLDEALPDALYPPTRVPALENLRVSTGKWSTRRGSSLWKTLGGSGDVRFLFDAYTSATIRIRLAARGNGAAAILYDYVEGTDTSFNAVSGGTALGGSTYPYFQASTLNGRVYLTDRAGALRVYQESPVSGNQLRSVALPTRPTAAPGVKAKTWGVLEDWTGNAGVAPYGWTVSDAAKFDIEAGGGTSDSPIGGTVVKLNTKTNPQSATIRENVTAEAVPSNTIAFWMYGVGTVPTHVAFQYGQVAQQDYTEVLDAPTGTTWYPVFVAIGSLGTINYKQFTVTENPGAADILVSRMVLPGRLDGSYRWVYTHYDPALLRESEPSDISNGGTPLDLSAIGTTFATSTAAAFQKSAALTFVSDVGTDTTTTKVRFYRSGGRRELTKDLNSEIDIWCLVGEVFDYSSTLNGAHSAAATTLTVASATNVAVGDWLVVEKGTVSKEEYVRVTSIAGAPALTVTPLLYAHSTGLAVQMAFVDNVANDTVDASVRIDLERDDPPVGCKFIQKAPDGRLWAFGPEMGIAVSNLATPLRPTDYEVFPDGVDPFTRQDPVQGFRAQVNGDVSDEQIIWGGFYQDRPYVLTRRSMYAINATSQVNWNSYAITKVHDVGCINGDTVCEVDGVLYWVADGPRVVRWAGSGSAATGHYPPQNLSHQRVNVRLKAAPTSLWKYWFAAAHTQEWGRYYSLFMVPDVTGIVAPSDLVATAVSSVEIDLTWTDASSDEDGFEIQRSTDNVTFTAIGTVAANVTSYAATGLTPATLYYWRVRAFAGVYP